MDLQDNLLDGDKRFVSGNVLTGTQINQDGFIGFYDFQIQGVNYNPFKNRWSFSERTFINYMFFATKS